MGVIYAHSVILYQLIKECILSPICLVICLFIYYFIIIIIVEGDGRGGVGLRSSVCLNYTRIIKNNPQDLCILSLDVPNEILFQSAKRFNRKSFENNVDEKSNF